MRISFIKMHGLGNDFVVMDGRTQALPQLQAATRAALCDRQTGIGCDQLILLEPSDAADLKMRIFNPDGQEASACGNAARAIGLLTGGSTRIETIGGMIQTRDTGNAICVDMGPPRFGWQDIPLAYAMDTAPMPVGWEQFQSPFAVNVGNPHVVFFVTAADDAPLDRLGPLIERDPLFPQGVNVNIAEVTGPSSIALRVWERGAGLTRACGTGACAAAVTAVQRGLVTAPVTVSLPGGTLQIAWSGETAGSSVIMTGPAAESFRGSFVLEDYL